MAVKPAPKKGASKSALDSIKKSARIAKKGKEAPPAKAKLPSSDDADERAPYKYPEGWKPPRSLAAAADLVYITREKRLAIEREAAKQEADEKALKHWIIENLPRAEAGGIAGKVARVSLVKKDVAQLADPKEFYAGIVKSYLDHKKRKDGMEDGAFAVLQRKLGEKAVQEMWAAGLTVPGVGKFTAVTLSINKL